MTGLATLASAWTVALTFDDLPVFGPFHTPAEGEDVTSRLLDGLKRHHLKAIGFVNEIQLANNYRPSRLTGISTAPKRLVSSPLTDLVTIHPTGEHGRQGEVEASAGVLFLFATNENPSLF
jgi:hypothetical protein